MHFPKWYKQFCFKDSGNFNFLDLFRSIWVFLRQSCSSPKAGLKLTLEPADAKLLFRLTRHPGHRDYKNVPPSYGKLVALASHNPAYMCD